jgi:hypothetical protein
MFHVGCHRGCTDREAIATLTRTLLAGAGIFLSLACGLLSDRAQAADTIQGLEISTSATAVLQGVAGPGATVGTDARKLHAPYSVDLGFTLPLRTGGAAGLILESGVGAGPDNDLSSISGLNADAVDEPAVHICEFWYEQTAGPVRWRAGAIDLTADLDGNAVANSETEQFLSPGFVNNLAVEFPAGSGLGLVVAVQPGAGLEFTLGAAEADADWTRVLARPFLAAQLSQSSAIRGRAGSRRVYAWRNSLPHQDLRCDNRGDEPGYGFGLSFDQSLAGPVAVFARVAQQRTAVYNLGSSWSAGMQATLPRLGRVDQTVGAALGRNHAASPWARLYKIETEGTDCSDELHYEVYDSFRVHEHLAVTVDLQRLDNPDGDSAAHRVWVPGLRLQYSR